MVVRVLGTERSDSHSTILPLSQVAFSLFLTFIHSFSLQVRRRSVDNQIELRQTRIKGRCDAHPGKEGCRRSMVTPSSGLKPGGARAEEKESRPQLGAIDEGAASTSTAEPVGLARLHRPSLQRVDTKTRLLGQVPSYD